MNRRIAKGRNFSREQLFHFPHQIREFPQGFLHRGGCAHIHPRAFEGFGRVIAASRVEKIQIRGNIPPSSIRRLMAAAAENPVAYLKT